MKQVKFRIVQTILPLLIGMFLSLGAYAQQITVKGHVKDAMGEPVIGAYVIAKVPQRVPSLTLTVTSH